MPREAEGIRLVRRRGRRCWYIADGARRVSTHVEDAEAARSVLDSYLDAKARGDGSVTAMLAHRMADLEARGSLTLPNARRIHARLNRALGHLHPGDVTEAVAQRFIASRCKATTAARRELEELRIALKRAGHPYAHIPLPPQPAPRDRFLTREQANRLLECCGSYHLRLWCLIAMTTGPADARHPGADMGSRRSGPRRARSSPNVQRTSRERIGITGPVVRHRAATIGVK